jgi:hypothetical protein
MAIYFSKKLSAISFLRLHISMSLMDDDTTNWKGWRIQLLLPLTAKSFIKGTYKQLNQPYKLPKGQNPNRFRFQTANPSKFNSHSA